MSLSDLPCLSDMQRARYATQKRDIPTRLDVKTSRIENDAKAEAAFRKAVWLRDKGLCRKCGRKVSKSLAVSPTRGEVHHLEGRANRALRYLPWNGVLLCAIHHQAVTRHELTIVQNAKDLRRVGQSTYTDGSKPVTFAEAKS